MRSHSTRAWLRSKPCSPVRFGARHLTSPSLSFLFWKRKAKQLSHRAASLPILLAVKIDKPNLYPSYDPPYSASFSFTESLPPSSTLHSLLGIVAACLPRRPVSSTRAGISAWFARCCSHRGYDAPDVSPPSLVNEQTVTACSAGRGFGARGPFIPAKDRSRTDLR